MEIQRKPQPSQTDSSAGAKKGENTNTQQSSGTTTSRGVSEMPDSLEAAVENGRINVRNITQPGNSESSQNYEYLKMIGADAVLSEAELRIGAADSQKLKDLLNIASNGQLLGSDGTSIARAKQEYLKNPSPATVNNELFRLVAESQNAPVEAARDAGLSSPKELLQLASNLALLGEEDVGRKMSDVATYQQIKEKGVDSILADTFRNSMGLPDATKGASLKELVDATTVAQKLGLDQTDNGFWEKVRKEGIAGVIADHRRTHGDGGDGPGAGRKKVVNQPYGRFVDKIIHSDHSGPRSNRKAGEPSVNPLDFGDRSKTNPSQNANNTQQNSATSSSQNKRFGDNSFREGPSFNRAPGARAKNSNQTATGGGASPAQGNANGPTQGTNSQGGAANDYSAGAGSAKQTGIGISAPTGTEAGSGATITAIGYERGSDGSITVTWSRSGGMDGQDGFYNTTYSQNPDGTWNYTVTDAITGDVVNTGTGDPPSEDIVGTSTQQVEDDGTIVFSTDTEDEDTTTAGTDDEGKPLPPGIGFERPDVIRLPKWFMPHDIDKPVDYLPPELMNFRPPIWDVSPKVPGNIDPVDPELRETRIGKGPNMRRSEGYTDPSETGGTRTPKNPEDQPPGPSHAKRKRGSHEHQQQMRRKGPTGR